MEVYLRVVDDDPPVFYVNIFSEVVLEVMFWGNIYPAHFLCLLGSLPLVSLTWCTKGPLPESPISLPFHHVPTFFFHTNLFLASLLGWFFCFVIACHCLPCFEGGFVMSTFHSFSSLQLYTTAGSGFLLPRKSKRYWTVVKKDVSIQYFRFYFLLVIVMQWICKVPYAYKPWSQDNLLET